MKFRLLLFDLIHGIVVLLLLLSHSLRIQRISNIVDIRLELDSSQGSVQLIRCFLSSFSLFVLLLDKRPIESQDYTIMYDKVGGASYLTRRGRVISSFV